MRKKLIWIAPLAIIGMAVFIAIGGGLVMHLWNWLLPMLFGWRQITFWQAVGLLALCRILFGGFGGRGLHRSNFRRRMAERWQRSSARAFGDVAARSSRRMPKRRRERRVTHTSRRHGGTF